MAEGDDGTGEGRGSSQADASSEAAAAWEGGRFRDRREAGRLLADRLTRVLGPRPGRAPQAGGSAPPGAPAAPGPLVVLGLPRGGVAVAAEVAAAMRAPLDIVVVRKLGVPYQPELAMGAVGEGGVTVLNEEVVHAARVGPSELARVAAEARAEVDRRAARFRRGRPAVPLEGRTAIVVDDGIATGSTAAAACRIVRARGAARVVLAVPVAPPSSIARLAEVADDVVVVMAPEWFVAVGQWYEAFPQLSDEEVVGLLEAAWGEGGAPEAPAGDPSEGPGPPAPPC
jgi:putative phosphoribosyl transferase